MKQRRGVWIVCAIFLLGGLSGWTLAQKGGNPASLFQGKTAEEAATALLERAALEAGKGSWELIAVGRAYYLSGDKAKGEELFARIPEAKREASDWFRLGKIYSEAGEWEKAWECYDQVFSKSPKNDTGMVIAGAWRNIAGDREGAEALFEKALNRNPKEFWHFVNIGGSYLGVPPQ